MVINIDNSSAVLLVATLSDRRKWIAKSDRLNLWLVDIHRSNAMWKRLGQRKGKKDDLSESDARRVSE
jgi:hypothetical protein